MRITNCAQFLNGRKPIPILSVGDNNKIAVLVGHHYFKSATEIDGENKFNGNLRDNFFGVV
jgi:hypothetical protein